jgi:hypothetical protein
MRTLIRASIDAEREANVSHLAVSINNVSSTA